MEDNGLGNIIFYIILALIGLAGSFTGKKKKAANPGAPKKSFSWPDLGDSTEHSFPDVFENAPAPEPAEKTKPAAKPVSPQATISKSTTYMTTAYDEGRHEEPLAKSFSGEGSYRDTLAESFSEEGSMVDEFTRRFSSEGSVGESVSAVFSGEGVSALKESQFSITTDDSIYDSQGNDIYEYDYNVVESDAEAVENFNLRKAVINSIILERKEYSY